MKISKLNQPLGSGSGNRGKSGGNLLPFENRSGSLARNDGGHPPPCAGACRTCGFTHLPPLRLSVPVDDGCPGALALQLFLFTLRCRRSTRRAGDRTGRKVRAVSHLVPGLDLAVTVEMFGAALFLVRLGTRDRGAALACAALKRQATKPPRRTIQPRLSNWAIDRIRSAVALDSA